MLEALVPPSLMPPLRPFARLYFAAFALALFAASQLRPVHNWDVIGYVAAAEGYGERDHRAVHARTYEIVERGVPPAWYAGLESGDPYRATMRADPDAFAEQQGYYRVRPLYALGVRALAELGVEPVRATHVLSGLAGLAGILALYALAGAGLARGTLLALPPLALAFGALDAARLATPDALAFLAVALCALLFRRGRDRTLCVALALLPLVRSELVLLSGPWLLALLVRAPADELGSGAAIERASSDRPASHGGSDPLAPGRVPSGRVASALARSVRGSAELVVGAAPRAEVLVALAVAAALALGLHAVYDHPGWATSLHATFHERPTHPLSAPPEPTLAEIARAYAVSLWKAVQDAPLLAFLALAGLALLLLRRRPETPAWSAALRSRDGRLVLVCAAYVAVHVALFPVVWTRFFVGPYLVVAVVFLARLAELLPVRAEAGLRDDLRAA